MIRYWICPTRLVPGGQRAEIGSTSSHSPKMMIRTMPPTNSGMAVADRPPMEMTRSSGFPTCRAAITPPRMPSGTRMTNAIRASLNDWVMAVASMSPTGRLKANEVPRSPCRTSPIQFVYWVRSGSLAPSSSLRALTASSDAYGPSIDRPGLPGRNMRPDEDQDRQHPEGDESECEAAGDEAEHEMRRARRRQPPPGPDQSFQAGRPDWSTQTWLMAVVRTPVTPARVAERKL